MASKIRQCVAKMAIFSAPMLMCPKVHFASGLENHRFRHALTNFWPALAALYRRLFAAIEVQCQRCESYSQ